MGAQKPWLLQERSSEWFIVLSIAVAAFTEIFVEGMMVPVMPFALNERLTVPTDNVQKWVSIMLAVSGVAQVLGSPIFGWFADRTTSRRQTFLIGLAALMLSNGILCFGKTITILLIGRVLQGFSAAAVWVVGLAMLVDTVGEDRVAESMGYISLATVSGLLSAPVLGGLVYDLGGYYSIFAVSFAFIALDILLRLLVIEQGSAAQWHDKNSESEYGTFEAPGPDYERTMPSEYPRRYSVNSRFLHSEPSKYTDTFSNAESPLITSGVGHATSSFAARLPPLLKLFLSPRLLVALWGCFAQTFLLTSFEGVLPLFVKKTFGWHSSQTGLMFFFLLSPTLAAPLIGRLSDRFGPRYIATLGFTFATPSIALLLLGSHPSRHSEILFSGLLFLIGIFLGFVMGPMGSEVSHVVRARMEEHPDMFGPSGGYAQAFAFFNVAFGAGSIVGPVWAGWVESWAGWGIMCWSLAMLSAVSVVPMVLFAGDIHDEDEYGEG